LYKTQPYMSKTPFQRLEQSWVLVYKICNRVMEHTRFLLLTRNTSMLKLCPRGLRQ